MLDEAEARERILANLEAGDCEDLPPLAALGRFAAGEYRAEIAVPGFDNSAMDGYALCVGDRLPAGSKLCLLEGEQPAGRDRGLRVAEGEALRIFTGAPMPAGGDGVVMQEDVALTPDGKALVLGVSVERGEFVRRAGSDLCAGQVVLRRGERLTATRCAILASQGWVDVRVVRAPKVTVVTTGNELLAPGGPRPRAGELYNSNGTMLAAMVREVCGQGTQVDHRHAVDTEEALMAILGEAINEGRVVIVSGGVSVGTHDLVRPVLVKLGVTGDFWRVRVKPGKPFYFGRHPGGVPVFGLPGNPVSSFVTFVLFVAPALRRLMGADPGRCGPTRVPCRLEVGAPPVENRGDRPHYIRGNLDNGMGIFSPTGIQQSHALFGLSQANALLRMDAGETVASGSAGHAILF